MFIFASSSDIPSAAICSRVVFDDMASFAMLTSLKCPTFTPTEFSKKAITIGI